LTYRLKNIEARVLSCVKGNRRQIGRKTSTWRRGIRAALAICIVSFAFPGSALAAQLQPETLREFNRYVQLSESQMVPEALAGASFLYVERLSPDRRDAALEQLHRGEVVIEKLETRENGKPIPIPDGMSHDWIGTIFIPGATLGQALSLEEDYDHHQKIFHPDVVRSKILRRDGDDFVVYFRLRKKKIITSILDTDHEVHYHMIDRTHAASRSRTTRIQEVENAGQSNESLKRVGDDNGFLWRMNTYWRFEERNGGTYVECRSISLTRDIPTGLGWMIGPFVTSIPRESLTFTLGTTRTALLKIAAARSGSVSSD
jgi:hypothetical protein